MAFWACEGAISVGFVVTNQCALCSNLRVFVFSRIFVGGLDTAGKNSIDVCDIEKQAYGPLGFPTFPSLLSSPFLFSPPLLPFFPFFLQFSPFFPFPSFSFFFKQFSRKFPSPSPTFRFFKCFFWPNRHVST